MSLKQRMDHRTDDEFEDDIDQFTEKEFYFGIAYRYDLCERGYPCSIEEHGVDNTGKLIPGRLPNHNVDKMYHFLDKRIEPLLIEIKTIPKNCHRFMTFKIGALHQCSGQGGQILVPKDREYYMFGKRSFQRMIDRCEVRTDIEEFGCKPCVRPCIGLINQMISEGMVMRKQWMPKAQDYVMRMDHVLFAKRRTSRKQYIST